MKGILVCSIVVALFCGCASKIGDGCSTNNDCGVNRICDRSQPGGYCTISPCELNACPKESVCISFDTTESFCMTRCAADGDCRSGYECVKNYGVSPFCNQKQLQ